MLPGNGTGRSGQGRRCKCGVRQITRREAERRGISERPEIERVQHYNQRLDVTIEGPRGVDPAWVGNPGKTRQQNLDRYMEGRLTSAPADVMRAAARDMAQSWRMVRLFENQARGKTPVAMMPGWIAEQLQRRSHVITIDNHHAGKGKTGRGETEPRHSDLNVEDYVLLQTILDFGTVFLDRRKNAVRAEMIINGEAWRVVVIKNQVRTFFRKDRAIITQARRTAEYDEVEIKMPGGA